MTWKSDDHDTLYEPDGRCKLRLSLIIVTRGDVPLDEVKRVNEWVCVTETVVWDNSQREDLAVYGRYAAIAETTENVILVVDDDVALDSAVTQLAAAYKPGHVVCNMPQRFRDVGFYDEHALVGFGALFDRDLPARAFGALAALDDPPPGMSRETFDSYVDDGGFFLRTCDVVFTALTPRILVDAPYRNLPWAEGADRMYRTVGHVEERAEMLRLARLVLEAA